MSQSDERVDLSRRRLYLCTPDRDDLEDFVAQCIEGVDIVQLRDKDLDAKPLIERARAIRDVCHSYSVPFILNDRPDLALEVDADGVHVGQDDAPARLARQILGPRKIVGLSTHRESDLDGAMREPVDYVSAGPVVETPTKPGRRGTGVDYIGLTRKKTANWPGRVSALPFFVTGGATPHSVGNLIANGADRVVAVRFLTEAQDPKSAARALRDAIEIGLSKERDAEPDGKVSQEK